jgi:hypothetical protein
VTLGLPRRRARLALADEHGSRLPGERLTGSAGGHADETRQQQGNAQRAREPAQGVHRTTLAFISRRKLVSTFADARRGCRGSETAQNGVCGEGSAG